MKKALILTSVASMIDQFNRDNITLLKEMKYEVHVACNFKEGSTTSKKKVRELRNELESKGVITHHLSIPRSITAVQPMLNAYYDVKDLLKKNEYELVHCHSPIGGVIGRLAAKNHRKLGTHVIYTAHGFHFYKGAPLQNWLLFYPIERFFSYYTDILITINQEDYQRAKKFHSNKVQYIPGVGINVKEINRAKVDVIQKKNELTIQENEFVLLSVGELNQNKNHEIIIKALSSIKQPYKYIICGQGKNESELKQLVKKLKISDQVIFTGYRKDVRQLLKLADIFCFPSLREGLSVALMEAMASGLPCVVSNIRGNRDLIDEDGGFLIGPKDISEFRDKIVTLMDNEILISSMGRHNAQKIKEFDIHVVNEKMMDIYQNL